MADKRTLQWLTCVLCFAAGVAATTISRRWLAPAAPPPLAISRTISPPKPHLADPAKPWGTLDVLRIPLADSQELFADRSARLQPPRWFFENHSEQRVADLLNSCELDEPLQKELLDRSKWLIVSNGCFVIPSATSVLRLSRPAREKIYGVLAESETNYAQQFPFRFPPGDFATRFQAAGLTAEHLDFLNNLTYTHWGDLCFADVQALTGVLSQDEFDRVINCLYRFSAYRIRLRVFPDSDIDALARYWGKGSRPARIRPMLESLAKVNNPEGTSMNISYFLPPFARLRLYTFPVAWTEQQANKEDCIWTALNFFNDLPDMRYLDRGFARQTLDADYSQITGQPTFGDLVTLINEHGDAIHMCVFVADDFVFTKNGVNPLQPWLLMKMKDMLVMFPSEKEYRIVIYRKKASSQERTTLPNARAGG